MNFEREAYYFLCRFLPIELSKSLTDMRSGSDMSMLLKTSVIIGNCLSKAHFDSSHVNTADEKYVDKGFNILSSTEYFLHKFWGKKQAC